MAQPPQGLLNTRENRVQRPSTSIQSERRQRIPEISVLGMRAIDWPDTLVNGQAPGPVRYSGSKNKIA